LVNSPLHRWRGLRAGEDRFGRTLDAKPEGSDVLVGSLPGYFWGLVWGHGRSLFQSTVIDESGFTAPQLDIPIRANSSLFGPVVGERKPAQWTYACL